MIRCVLKSLFSCSPHPLPCPKTLQLFLVLPFGNFTSDQPIKEGNEPQNSLVLGRVG